MSINLRNVFGAYAVSAPLFIHRKQRVQLSVAFFLVKNTGRKIFPQLGLGGSSFQFIAPGKGGKQFAEAQRPGDFFRRSGSLAGNATHRFLVSGLVRRNENYLDSPLAAVFVFKLTDPLLTDFPNLCSVAQISSVKIIRPPDIKMVPASTFPVQANLYQPVQIFQFPGIITLRQTSVPPMLTCTVCHTSLGPSPPSAWTSWRLLRL